MSLYSDHKNRSFDVILLVELCKMDLTLVCYVELQIKAMKQLFLCEAEVHVQSFMLKSVVLKIKPFDLYESSSSNFSQHYRPHFIHESHENMGNDYQLEEFLIVNHILLVNTSENL